MPVPNSIDLACGIGRFAFEPVLNLTCIKAVGISPRGKGSQVMGGLGRTGRKRVLITVLVLILAAAAARVGSTSSCFSSTTTVSGNVISFGTWGPVPRVCKACPCFGVTGICSWAVFLYGSDLCQVNDIELVKGTVSVPAKKLWHIGDGILYCVFDLRGVATGSYDIVARTTTGQEVVVYRGFVVVGLCGGGSGRCSAAAQTSVTVEDPLEFKVFVSNDDPSSLLADLGGPVRSSFVSALLVANGVQVDGAVESVSGNGLRVRFARKAVSAGTYDLVVTRSDGSSLLVEGSFTARPYVSPMNVTGIQPSSGTQGQVVQMRVSGSRMDLANGIAIVQGSSVIQPAAPVILWAGQLGVTFDLARAAPGPGDLYVSCVDGTQQVLPGCVMVLPMEAATDSPAQEPATQPADQSAPQQQAPDTEPASEAALGEVTPDQCMAGTLVQFTATGTGLTPDLRVKLVADSWWGWALGVKYSAGNELRCVFDLRGAPAGLYRLALVKPDGTEVVYEKPIKVEAAQQDTAEGGIRRAQ